MGCGMVRCALALGLLLGLATGQDIPTEAWGYVDISPKAHLFYWLYGCTTVSPSERALKPLVIWTNGGPGGSSFNGDFMEIGPLDVEQKVRNTTWASEVNLLFLDQPVGTGYSYVEDDEEFVTTKEQINEHLLITLREIFALFPAFQETPLYLFGQSYGGKVMADFGVHLHRAIENQDIKANFRGVGLGDPWIYPLGMVSTYGAWLQSLSQLDAEEVQVVDAYARQMEEALSSGQNKLATSLWSAQQLKIVQMTGGVDFYDYTKNSKPSDNRLDELMKKEETKQRYSIPDHVTWGSQRPTVFDKLENEFMLDCLDSIDYLLNFTAVEVNIYNGSFDLIVDTPGIKLSVSRLRWEGLPEWLSTPRENVRVGGQEVVLGNRKCHKNLCTYYLLNSGHSAPADSPLMALQMLKEIVA